MSEERYFRVLLWAGRGLAVLAFFLPYGPVLTFVVLALAELLYLLYRQVRALEALEVEAE